MSAVTAATASAVRETTGMDHQTWGMLLLAPYIAVFIGLVAYPLAYGFYLGSDLSSYRRLFQDPAFITAFSNTILFLFIAVNLKFALAMVLSGFFVVQRPWIQIVLALFILPWAIPSIPTILSFRVMLNPETGLVNSQLFNWFGIVEGPGWLTTPNLAFGSAIMVHIWKSLPFWTLILVTGRLAISRDLYEAAQVDGATRLQMFRWITWPSMAKLYVTSTLLSMIWTLGDFNSVYLLTSGGPGDTTQVLSTLGIRYMRSNNLDLAIDSIIVAMPIVLPMVWIMVRRLSGGSEQ